MKDYVKQFLLSEGMASTVQEIDEGFIVTTTILSVQDVITELYTSGYSNFVVTVVSSLDVQIRTEEIQ